MNLMSHTCLVTVRISFMTGPAFALINKPTVSKGKFSVKEKNELNLHRVPLWLTNMWLTTQKNREKTSQT